MANKPTISVETLRQLLTYNPETGSLTWLPRPLSMFATQRHCSVWNARYAGAEALTALHNGYRCGDALGHRIIAHRVAYALHHGRWPEGDIDHINGNRADNRIVNLRAVNRQTNMQNAKRSKANSSGVTGVCWDRRRCKWRAYIVISYRQRSIGEFVNLDDAIAARQAAEIEFGFHENHGRAA